MRIVGRRVLAIAIILFTLSSLANIPKESRAYTAHDPIFIDRDGNFTAANGVTGGSGISTDPYIIEGWEINASEDHGIHIRNVGAHFIIRDTRIHADWSSYGVWFYNVSNAKVESVVIERVVFGIYLQYTANVTVSSNSMLHVGTGILSYYSTLTTITSNDVSESGDGVRLRYSHNNSLRFNDFSYNSHGVYLEASNDNIINNNTAVGNGNDAISVTHSIGNVIADNTMIEAGIFIEGDSLQYWNTHTIATSNTVNGRPVYYWKNVSGGTIPPGAGQVILANCTGVVTEGQNVSNASAGIQLGYSIGNTIRDNLVFGNYWYGIYLYRSHDNSLARNTVSENAREGIFTWHSSGNYIVYNDVSSNYLHGIHVSRSDGTVISDNMVFSHDSAGIAGLHSNDLVISNNTAADNEYGLYLGSCVNTTLLFNNATHNSRGIQIVGSSDIIGVVGNTVHSNSDRGMFIAGTSNATLDGNSISGNAEEGLYLSYSDNITIANNTMSHNEVGLYLEHSIGNEIYNNNFSHNSVHQAFDDNGTNQWDDGYPSGGNSWSDYTGFDEMKGPEQDQPGSDGLGDMPYDIPGGNGRDRYPVTNRHNEPPTVVITTPTSGLSVSGTWRVAGTASDNDGTVARVEIRIDSGPWLGVSGTTSWSFDWDTTMVANGVHTISARCHDGIFYSETLAVNVVVENPVREAPVFEQAWFWVTVGLIAVFVAASLILERTGRRKEPEG